MLFQKKKKKLWIDKDLVPKKNNPNKNIDILYGDCPVPIGSPRDTNVEWYPLTEISDCAQFFSDGIESNDFIQGFLGNCWLISALSVLATKDYLLRGEFNEEMLGDKNLDSEEYTMLSTGVYPPIFHSFRKKAFFVLDSYGDMFQQIIDFLVIKYIMIIKLLPYYMVNTDQMMNS